MNRFSWLARLGLLALLVVLAGCGGPTAPALPAAADLLSESAQAMAGVRSLAWDVRADPALTQLPVRAASGKLTASGEATGTATMAQGASTAKVSFAVVGGSAYLKEPTGRARKVPLSLVATFYDPTTPLRPDHGIAAMLRTATSGVTQAREDVNGVPAYRVQAHLDPNLVGGLFPGLAGADSGTLWIDATTHRLLRAELPVPNAAGGPPAPVTVTLSDFDTPVTVTPPS